MNDTRSTSGWAWPLALGLVLTGLAYYFWWGPMIEHQPVWTVGGDAWGIYRAAHFVGWGDIGGAYAPAHGLVSCPGVAVLLAPVAWFTGALHLSESFPPFIVPHASAGLVFQPIELAMAASVLFPVARLAGERGIDRRLTHVVLVVMAVLAWPTAAVWGHGEDTLAVTMALWTIVALAHGSGGRSGWLLGFGIVMQPLVVMLFPLFWAVTPSGRRAIFTLRSAVPSAGLLGAAFLSDPGDTWRAVVVQPTPPSLNHPTPWIAWSPRVPIVTSQSLHSVLVGGRPVATEHVLRHTYEVAGGPGRLVDLVVALAVAVWAWRRPPSPAGLIWLSATVLAARCFLEAVMTPYYVMAPLMFLVLAAAGRSTVRFVLASVLALFVEVYSYGHYPPWVWWTPIVVALSVMLVLGCPDQVGTPTSTADRSCVSGPEDVLVSSQGPAAT